MIETPVGMKCPSCGRPAVPAAEGRRRLGGVAGLVTAGLIASGLSLIGGPVGVILPLAVGVGSGAVVRKVGRPGTAGLIGTAGLAAAFGMALAALAFGTPLTGLLRVNFIFAALISALVAAFTAGR
jgi:hypothetical protein